MWSLFPQLLWAAKGSEDDQKGGFGFASLPKICETIQIYIMKDPSSLLETNENQEVTRLQSILIFAKRCFEIIKQTESYAQGAPVLKVLLALLENMRKLIDSELPQIITLIVQEISTHSKLLEPSKQYLSDLAVAFLMCFSYNPFTTFRWLNYYTEQKKQPNLVVETLKVCFEALIKLHSPFDLRRATFGLSAIIYTPHDQMDTAVVNFL